jgi:hypothetical protein
MCFWFFILLVERHPSWTDWLVAGTWVLIALTSILDQIFFYWEVEPALFRQRRYWSKKEVAWETVTVVRDYTLWGLPSDYLEVDFVRPASKSGRGRILARPKDRKEFIAMLRERAPRATFTV